MKRKEGAFVRDVVQSTKKFRFESYQDNETLVFSARRPVLARMVPAPRVLPLDERASPGLLASRI
jgi:hypothetical protein